MRRPLKQIAFLILSFFVFFSAPLLAEDAVTKPLPNQSASPQVNPNPFVQEFFMRPDQRLKYKASEIQGIVFVEVPNPEQKSRYAVVTGFGPNILKTQSISHVNALPDLQAWVDGHLEVASAEGVEIKRLTFPEGKGKEAGKRLYWVGHKSFASARDARAQIELVKTVIESEGGDFRALASEAQANPVFPDQTPSVEIKSPAQFQKEEELMLRFMDHLDIGNQLFGPLQGEGVGEPILWQSFGETSWRLTNLEAEHYDTQVGFWTNRIVFKGIRFPVNTLDLFVEVTPSLESTGIDFKSHLKLFGGVEWRPFARNAWVYNYRPWGGIGILEWIRNWRIYLMYGDRKNLKDEITGSKDYDLITGAQIFYEWGIELPAIDQKPPSRFSEWVEQYVWGEYFGDYRYEKTNFGAEDDFDAAILDSTVTLGLKTPGIPLPANPLAEELVLMPYVRFAYITNTEFSFPFQNRYFVAAGVRWMPFRNYRYKENEWLAKTKIFAEYVGIGDTINTRQDDEAPNAIEYDLRLGVSLSSRRY